MAIQLKISHPVKNIKVLKIAIKINSKGLMVAASPQFSLGDELILNFDQGLKLNGKIFKFSQNNQGQIGMIIQFIDLSNQHKKALQQLLAQEKLNTSNHDPMAKDSAQQETQAMLGEKTIITDLNSLDHLALQSPDQNPNFVASTLDEENFKNSLSNNDLAQKTRIEIHLPKMAQNRKKSRRKKYLGVLVIALAATALKLGVDKKFQGLWQNNKPLQDKIPEVVSVQDVKKQARQQTEPNKNKTPTKPKQKKITPKTKTTVTSKRSSSVSTTQLTQLNYVKTAAFYKISISATKKLTAPKVIRLSDPRRIRIEFANVNKGKTRSRIQINDRTLNNIHTQQVGKSTRIEINLNQNRYPRYDVKTYDRFADIFVYTVN